MEEVEYNVKTCVFARLRGFPPWPARIDEIIGKGSKQRFRVMFYGTHQTGVVKKGDLTPYNQETKQSTLRPTYLKRKFYQEALDELEDSALPSSDHPEIEVSLEKSHKAPAVPLDQSPRFTLPPRKSFRRRYREHEEAGADASTAQPSIPDVILVSDSPAPPKPLSCGLFTSPEGDDDEPELSLPPRALRRNKRRLELTPSDEVETQNEASRLPDVSCSLQAAPPSLNAPADVALTALRTSELEVAEKSAETKAGDEERPTRMSAKRSLGLPGVFEGSAKTKELKTMVVVKQIETVSKTTKTKGKKSSPPKKEAVSVHSRSEKLSTVPQEVPGFQPVSVIRERSRRVTPNERQAQMAPEIGPGIIDVESASKEGVSPEARLPPLLLKGISNLPATQRGGKIRDLCRDKSNDDSEKKPLAPEFCGDESSYDMYYSREVNLGTVSRSGRAIKRKRFADEYDPSSLLRQKRAPPPLKTPPSRKRASAARTSPEAEAVPVNEDSSLTNGPAVSISETSELKGKKRKSLATENHQEISTVSVDDEAAVVAGKVKGHKRHEESEVSKLVKTSATSSSEKVIKKGQPPGCESGENQIQEFCGETRKEDSVERQMEALFSGSDPFSLAPSSSNLQPISQPHSSKESSRDKASNKSRSYHKASSKSAPPAKVSIRAVSHLKTVVKPGSNASDCQSVSTDQPKANILGTQSEARGFSLKHTEKPPAAVSEFYDSEIESPSFEPLRSPSKSPAKPLFPSKGSAVDAQDQNTALRVAREKTPTGTHFEAVASEAFRTSVSDYQVKEFPVEAVEENEFRRVSVNGTHNRQIDKKKILKRKAADLHSVPPKKRRKVLELSAFLRDESSSDATSEVNVKTRVEAGAQQMDDSELTKRENQGGDSEDKVKEEPDLEERSPLSSFAPDYSDNLQLNVRAVVVLNRIDDTQKGQHSLVLVDTEDSKMNNSLRSIESPYVDLAASDSKNDTKSVASILSVDTKPEAVELQQHDETSGSSLFSNSTLGSPDSGSKNSETLVYLKSKQEQKPKDKPSSVIKSKTILKSAVPAKKTETARPPITVGRIPDLLADLSSGDTEKSRDGVHLVHLESPIGTEYIALHGFDRPEDRSSSAWEQRIRTKLKDVKRNIEGEVVDAIDPELYDGLGAHERLRRQAALKIKWALKTELRILKLFERLEACFEKGKCKEPSQAVDILEKLLEETISPVALLKQPKIIGVLYPIRHYVSKNNIKVAELVKSLYTKIRAILCVQKGDDFYATYLQKKERFEASLEGKDAKEVACLVHYPLKEEESLLSEELAMDPSESEIQSPSTSSSVGKC